MKEIKIKLIEKSCCIVVLACLLLAIPATAATYYIDYVGGNDSNNGTSTATPWKHHPYMFHNGNGCGCGSNTVHSYSHSAGDRFIFKGGVTVDKCSLVMTIVAGGSAMAPDYYGVDKSWYSGSSWSRPILSEGGTYDYGYFDVQADYVIIDNFDMTGFYWGPDNLANCGKDPYGDLAGIAVNTSEYVTIENCYFHGWTHASSSVFTSANPGASYDNLKCCVGNAGTANTGCIVSNCVFDGTASGGDSGAAVFCLPTVINCVVSNMSNGLLPSGDPGEVAGCVIGPINLSFDAKQHENSIEQNGLAGLIRIHNNIIFSPTAVCILVGSPGGPAYIYDNLIYDSAPPAVEVDSHGGGASILHFYNNTVVKGTGDQLDSGTITAADNGVHRWDVYATNNQFIGIASIGDAISGTYLNVYENYNLVQSQVTTPGANLGDSSDGYFLRADLWKPNSSSAPTVDAGYDLSGLSSTLPTIETDLFGVPRPEGSGWDIGAYEYRRIVNIDFGGSMTGVAAIGNYFLDYWNNVAGGAYSEWGATPYDVVSEVDDLLDADGNATSGLNVQVLASDITGEIPMDGPTYSDPIPLIASYLATSGGDSFEIVLDLPTGHTYDVYLYSAIPYYNAMYGGRPTSTFTSVNTSISQTPSSSNYPIDTFVVGHQCVAFTGLSAGTWPFDISSGVEPYVNGVQIIIH